ncbi:MAG: glutamate-ammonia-ligase adenylyltransferase [Gammaproteobacteria bacterium]|jgi:glutamate-ammonia-ligase adenylyltransferase
MPPKIADLPAILGIENQRCLSSFIESCDRSNIDYRGLDLDLAQCVWAASPFCAALAVADPLWFIDEFVNGEVSAHTASFYTVNVADVLTNAGNPDVAYSRLRQFRNREIARIAWRDIAGDVSPTDISTELSHLADACIERGLRWARDQLSERFGVAINADGVPLAMTVIAMGKLGGHELNFSSDIDLIFAYRESGTSSGGRREISHQEYFDRLGKLLIGLLNQITAAGFVFRVDMRLRPFGDSGPLCTTFGSLEHYYQLHGRDWERYAFIKARIISEDADDREKLSVLLKPFVYRRYLDYGALEAVREMKALINAEVSRKELHDNVKLGSGGIREIEFIGQTMQLIRGGRELNLQHRSILKVLKVCNELGIIDREDCNDLTQAYVFLRRSEHRLQQVNDQQTHQLPATEVEQARLAYGMGFASYGDFETTLNHHRGNVRRCFSALLSASEPSGDPGSARLVASQSLWQASELSDSTLMELGFDNPHEILEILEQLKHPRFQGRLSQTARDRLNALMPKLIDAIGQRAPNAKTFRRIGDLLQAIARRSVYLSLLTEHPVTLNRLIDLFSASPWIAGQIVEQPLLLDELLDPRVLFAPPAANQLIEKLGKVLTQFDEADVEHLMDALRNFKNQQVLRVAASDVMDQFPVAEVSNQLSYIAGALLHHALHIGSKPLVNKHGSPYCGSETHRSKVGFAVIAYGKLGGYELGYGSDLDLVFLHDGAGQNQETDGPHAVANNVFFTRLTQRVIHILGTRTGAGRAYEIDTRLRPSGESGLLVTSVEAFVEYQKKNAWTWEHQALIRARAVAGTLATMTAFEQGRVDILSSARDADKLKDDVLTMRSRMRKELDRSDGEQFDVKQGAGGITDIEFMVQYAVLRWANRHPELLTFTDNLRLLEVLVRLELFSTEIGSSLRDAYFAYRAETHRCALQESDVLADRSAFSEHRDAVTRVWHDTFEHHQRDR